MKTLEQQFVANHEKTGNHTFFQMGRTDSVAFYKRITEEGKLFGYEVFRVKTRLKGQALPGGGEEAEDREVYPKGKSFKTNVALFISGPNAEDRARGIFNEWTKAKVEVVEDEDDSDETDETPVLKTARTPVPPTDYVIPDGEFSNIMFSEANGLPPIGKGYFALKAILAEGKIREVARRKVTEGRGRATVFYSKV
jgi:hypothetical protein